MFTLTLACFAILLFRYAQQTDIIIGSPVANRRPETEPLIGPFSGPIALRLDLSGNPTLRDVIRRANDVFMEALDHADLPFETLLGQIRVQRTHGRSLFFQFYFLYQTAFLQPRELPGVTVDPMPAFSVGTPFELQLAMIERPDGVRANVEYNSDLFNPATIKHVLQYYEKLLQALAADPDCRVANLELSPDGASFGKSRTAGPVAPSPYVAPRTDDEVLLADIWRSLLKIPTIGVHDNFFDLGAHSLLAAQLISEVQKKFGVTFDLSTLLIAPTIEQMAQRIKDFSERRQSHLVSLRTSGANPPLFLVHGAGGHLLDYRDMVAAMPEDRPIYGLRASDLNDVDEPETVEQLAAKYLQEIQKIQEHGPYQICGLSFGGLVAYEIARTLADKGEQVGVIGLLDTGNWSHYRNLPPAEMVKFRRAYMVDRLKKYGQNLIRGRFNDISADARQFVVTRFNVLRWKLIRQACRVVNRPVPKAVRSPLVIFTAVGRAFTPKPYPGRLLLFRAEGRTAEYGDDETLGWDGLALEGIAVHHVPGGHLTIMHKPHVYRLVEQLNDYLADSVN